MSSYLRYGTLGLKHVIFRPKTHQLTGKRRQDAHSVHGKRSGWDVLETVGEGRGQWA